MKILIIDDEKLITNFFGQMAMARGYSDIDTVESGEEALNRVLRKTFDLITVDIQMPGASGLDIIAMLRNLNAHAVIAVISGHLPEHISREAASCVDVMISKPVSVDIFNHLLDGAAQIGTIMNEIRLLGTVPEA